MQANTMGWDIGGAHLKAAIIRPPNKIIAIYQQPCPLWKGLDKLYEAAQAILDDVMSPRQHAITMTGELVDLFSGRDEGVQQILNVMSQLLPASQIKIYAGKHGLLPLRNVNTSDYVHIASANWLASTTWAAQKLDSGLFVDIGSTTTDILLFDKGKVLAKGYTDYHRLISQEMIYTGVVRTPVMAVSQFVEDQEESVGLMAEYFATMADVFRVTGELNELHDKTDTADGAEKTRSASAKRLARMIGCDYEENELVRWQKLANNLRQQQVARIQQVCEQQLARIELPKNTPIVGAGIGRFLVRQIADNLNLPYQDFSDFFDVNNNHINYAASDCAPAVALACLAAKDTG